MGLRAAEDPYTQIKKYHPPSTTKEGWHFTYKVDIVLEETDFPIEQQNSTFTVILTKRASPIKLITQSQSTYPLRK